MAPKLNGMIIFLLAISFFWTSTVLSNILHCTISGVVSHWWSRENSSKNIVYASFMKSVTQLFGSICLGSLLVATIRALRTTVSILTDTLRRSVGTVGHGVGGRYYAWKLFLLQLLETILSILDQLMTYFNKYALCFGEVFLSIIIALLLLIIIITINYYYYLLLLYLMYKYI